MIFGITGRKDESESGKKKKNTKLANVPAITVL